MNKDLNKNKILIVGGAGFVGSNLTKYLLEEKNPKKIYIIDNLISSEASSIPDNEKVIFICGSIADDFILNKIPKDIEYVFHLSCYHGNQSSIFDPIADHDNNTITTLKLFNHLKEFKSLKRVIYAAAGCAVAKKTFANPVATKEDASLSLYHDSPYSISKLVGEMYGNYFFKQNNLPIVKARFQNIYGPGEILGAGIWRGTINTIWRNVIPTFIWKSLAKESLPLENGGINSRDFIFVKDICRGLACCASNGKPGESYNLASGIEKTILEVANLINKYTGNEKPCEIKPIRDWDKSGKRFGSTVKSREEIGFVAQQDFEEGLKLTIEWTKKNKEFIQRNINKHNYKVGLE